MLYYGEWDWRLQYVNYYSLTNKEYLNRTNNYLESFHGTFNEILDCFHPKISFMINKYKDYLIEVSIVNKENIKIEKFSIFEDIRSFISNYNNKYK